jgi:hypothetical protein
MHLRRRTILESASTLRICLLVALIFALNTSHLGMSAQAHEMSMTMTQAGHVQEGPSHGDPQHSKMDGSLCATLCLGTDKLDGGDVVGRVEKFVAATWLGEVGPAWISLKPDPAQRPPDTLHHT